MGKVAIILYSISLLMVFSPPFLYILLRQFGIFYPSITTQIASLVPFIMGISLLALLKIKKFE